MLSLIHSKIPISGRNPNFEEVLIGKPHILLLNKTDLTDIGYKSELSEIYKSQGISKVMHITSRGDSNWNAKKKVN